MSSGAQGMDAPTARAAAEQVSRDPEQALQVHAREELGLDPTGLPSPYTAAGASFVCFAVGALLPCCRSCSALGLTPCPSLLCWQQSSPSSAGWLSAG